MTASGNTLSSSSAGGNQWYWDGTAVSGATQQTYTVPAASFGYYWTIVSLSGCVSDTSNHVYIKEVGIDENETLIFSLYPVPNNGEFTADLSSSFTGKYRILIYNTLGEIVYSTEGIRKSGPQKVVIDLHQQPAGIYSVVFLNEQRKAECKVIINK